MDRNVHCDETFLFEPNNFVDWNNYYPKLLSISRCFVYMYHLACWRGQEEDMAEDVAQETIRRMIQRIHKSVQGKAKPINSVEHMMTTIARNYVRDLRRRDRRMVLSSDTSLQRIVTNMNELGNTLETATEHIFHEWVFLQVAREIDQLPHKQRRAILTDLANRMSFNSQPTPLQAAFLLVGIDLQDYQQPIPENSIERARHAALLSLAYKRIAQLSAKYDLFSVA